MAEIRCAKCGRSVYVDDTLPETRGRCSCGHVTPLFFEEGSEIFSWRRACEQEKKEKEDITRRALLVI